MTAIQAIPIELIRTDGGTQIRDCKTMQTKIAEYATAMSEGNEFPPLTVFWDGEFYWLADGFHRLGAYNIVMQALELPGLDIDCEVIEGSLREAIIFACGVNAVHGIQRTVPDKQNAVRTMLTNPVVALTDAGVPWSSRRLAGICRVSHTFVDKEKERLRQEKEKQQQEQQSQDASGNVATCVSYERNGNVVTQVTGGGQTAAPEIKQPEAAAATSAETPSAEDKSPEPVAQAEQKPKPETAPTAVVVEFTSKWDFIYDRLKEVDRAIAELPEPHVAASKFPPTLAHGVTVARCLEIQRWWLEFTRLWAARNPEASRQLDLEEKLNATSR
jgi:hypothetical protein